MPACLLFVEVSHTQQDRTEVRIIGVTGVGFRGAGGASAVDSIVAVDGASRITVSGFGCPVPSPVPSFPLGASEETDTSCMTSPVKLTKLIEEAPDPSSGRFCSGLTVVETVVMGPEVEPRLRGETTLWSEREFTDRKVRGSNPTSGSRLTLCRLGRPGTILALMLPSDGMAGISHHQRAADFKKMHRMQLRKHQEKDIHWWSNPSYLKQSKEKIIGTRDHRTRWLKWLEREITDRKARAKQPSSRYKLSLKRQNRITYVDRMLGYSDSLDFGIYGVGAMHGPKAECALRDWYLNNRTPTCKRCACCVQQDSSIYAEKDFRRDLLRSLRPTRSTDIILAGDMKAQADRPTSDTSACTS
ncbi:hypothetical protein T265_06285 [Opisthorchis viverrini]|uniref:Uncharacterized protein n=1 Tax=Opisthorchis viverrini TaxID=6198 RepID=A0A074ZL32_OPIVI|nr:hypothetical protein T265_06285 [Opisthorchis viverrini]KER26497.1 hypothetical protein T265_06285 [Opisthorchis viverrini]